MRLAPGDAGAFYEPLGVFRGIVTTPLPGGERQSLRPRRGDGRRRKTTPTTSLAGNAVLHALVADNAENLRFCHATSNEAKLRTL
jgi:hypothetical protein